MRKLFILFLIFVSLLNASEKEYAAKIIKNLVEVIDKPKTSVWIDQDGSELIGSAGLKQLSIVETCKQAKVLILSNGKGIPKSCIDKPILVLDYELLVKHSNAVSAFFWQKGRPNIVFIKKRLEKYSISLPSTYDKYVEEQIW